MTNTSSRVSMVLLMVLPLLCECKLIHDCGSNSLTGCHCEKTYHDGKTQFVVNCTDQGFTTVDMLKNLPEETEVLVFTGNHIPELPWNVFGELKNFTRLRTVDMSNNGIREIKGKSYHHVPNVELLILNHNKLRISDEYHHPRIFSNFINLAQLHLTNAFADYTADELADDLRDIFVNSNLTKLFKLHLEQNEIRHFSDENVFCSLTSLRDLYLGENFIPALNFNITCLPRLQFLDLQQNNITHLASLELDAFDRLAEPQRRDVPSLMIDIRGNPFRCDEERTVSTLYEWLERTRVSVRFNETLQCHATRNGNRYVLNMRHFHESKRERMSKTVTVLVCVLVVAVLAIAATYLYLTKGRLKTKLKPLFVVVSGKVHYSTIDSQADV